MERDFFQSIYNSSYINQKYYREIASAHIKMDIPKGKIVLKEGKTAQEYYIIEKGLFRSFV